MSRLIGLGGKLRAGKDAVADYLSETHGFRAMGMSDALNDALLTLNPWVALTETTFFTGSGWRNFIPYRELHAEVGYVEAKKIPEVRRLLQVLGTEVGREMFDPDVWAHIAEKRIRSYLADGRDVVITAVRFPNEVEMINRLGGLTVWVERPETARYEGVGSTESASHQSENSVGPDDFAYVLTNDGTLDALYRRVEKRLIRREGVPEAPSGPFHPPYDR